MTTLSKVLIGFSLLSALGAMILMSAVIEARSLRLEKVDLARTKSEQARSSIVEDELALKSLSSRVESLERRWGRVWPDVRETDVIPGDQGLVELGVGARFGLGAAELKNGAPLPSVHLFGLNNGAEGVYMGEFALTAVEGERSTARLRRAPLPNEADLWASDTYRVRTEVPPAYAKLMNSLRTSYTTARQAAEDAQARLDIVGEQLAATRATLNSRLVELNGAPELPEDAPAVLTNGLIATLESTSEDRDTTLAEVDRLRRIYRDKHDEYESLLARVKELASRLPGNGGSTGVSQSAAKAASLGL